MKPTGSETVPARRQILIPSLILVVALALLTAWAGSRPARVASLPPTPPTTEAPTRPPTETPTPVPSLTPVPSPEPTVESALDDTLPTAADEALYATLLETTVPDNDRRALAAALGRIGPGEAGTASPAAAYEVGDHAMFWIDNRDNNTVLNIEAELMAVSDHATFWLDTESVAAGPGGTALTADGWQATGAAFDAAYEAVRAVFGTEDSPGIDGDARLTVLNTDRVGQVGGYFSGADTVPAAVFPYSNQREMFVMSIDGAAGIGSAYYLGTLAHEYFHMIQWNLDPNEDLWLNEGLAKLAQQIAGGRGDDNAADYLLRPDKSLWFFGNERQDYGQAYLVADYLYERFGADFIGAVVADPANGFASLDGLLAGRAGESFDAVYGDYLAALVVNDPALADGRYAFAQARFSQPQAAARLERGLTAVVGTVNPYGLDMIRIPDPGGRTVTFEGEPVVRLVPADAASGSTAWWSNRREMAAPTLTRVVDLTGVDRATLTFQTWYSIEPGWDYAYVLVSTDGGITWTPLETSLSTDDNPHGANQGKGITGFSGGLTGVSQWVEASADLTSYAGQVIELRFLPVTDEGLTLPGLLLDDIAIPEIGFFDDAETPDAGWAAEGFVRSHNRVPQRWLVLAITREGDDAPPEIRRLDVVDGRAVLPGDPAVTDVTLLVSGLTRFTDQAAGYRVEVGAP